MVVRPIIVCIVLNSKISNTCMYMYVSDMQLHGNDVDVRYEVDTAQRRDLRDYTSPLRLLILSSITLSLWYSVGVGVSQIKTSVCYMYVTLALLDLLGVNLL